LLALDPRGDGWQGRGINHGGGEGRPHLDLGEKEMRVPFTAGKQPAKPSETASNC